MVGYISCHQYMDFNDEHYYTTREQHPEFHINFRFLCDRVLHHYINDPNSGHIQRTIVERLPRLDKSIRFTLQQFLLCDQARQTIDNKLRAWPVWEGFLEDLINKALKTAHNVLGSVPANHNAVYVAWRGTSSHHHFLDERGAVDLTIQQSMEDNTSYMVPAVDSCVEALKKMLVMSSDETCCVCFEEFDDGTDSCEGLCMPCSHVFHEDCIKKWLKTSHYCPVCRFEMPTSQGC